MHRLTLFAGLLAFSFFNYAQYQGWSMFSDEAQSQQQRPVGTAGSAHSPLRSYHK